jgi:ATP-dependent Lon protease
MNNQDKEKDKELENQNAIIFKLCKLTLDKLYAIILSLKSHYLNIYNDKIIDDEIYNYLISIIKKHYDEINVYQYELFNCENNINENLHKIKEIYALSNELRNIIFTDIENYGIKYFDTYLRNILTSDYYYDNETTIENKINIVDKFFRIIGIHKTDNTPNIGQISLKFIDNKNFTSNLFSIILPSPKSINIPISLNSPIKTSKFNNNIFDYNNNNNPNNNNNQKLNLKYELNNIKVEMELDDVIIILDGYFIDDVLNEIFNEKGFYDKICKINKTISYLTDSTAKNNSDYNSIIDPYLYFIDKKFEANKNKDTNKKYHLNYSEIPESFRNDYIKHISIKNFLLKTPYDIIFDIAEDFCYAKKLSLMTTVEILNIFYKLNIIEKFKLIKLLLIKNSEKNIMDISLLLDIIKKNDKSTVDDLISCLPSSLKIRIKNINSNDKISSSVSEISYESKLALLNVSDNIKTLVMEKIKEFKSSKESSKAETYIDAFFRIPFDKFKKEEIFIKCHNNNNNNNNINILDIKKEKINYLNHVNNVLNSAVYGHDDSKREIKRIIAQWMNGRMDGVILGFHGPPGVGKTCFAKKGIANCLIDQDGNSRPFCIFQLGGAQDGATLEGHNYTYIGAKYGRLVEMLMESKCMNPIIYFDELDKVSNTEKGQEIIDILIHLTDKSQNKQIYDRYFSGIELDFSKCIIIFSYNDSSKIDHILKDRITEIKINPLNKDEKIVIVNNFLLKEISDNIGMDCKINNELISYIIDEYTNEAGVRKLSEKLYEIFREINLRLLEYDNYNFILDKSLIDIILNRHHKPILKSIHSSPTIGMINGLFATSIGIGGIIPIQVKKLHIKDGNLNLLITGQQGDVMKESMTCAKTIVLNLLTDHEKLKLNSDLTNNPFDIHIHCPDASTPKDGPSAGCAIALAIYSLLCEKLIKNDIAITGEIDLFGNIKAIGGLEQKIRGGIKSGVKTIFFPSENNDDFLKIKNNDFNINFIICNNIINIIDKVFV